LNTIKIYQVLKGMKVRPFDLLRSITQFFVLVGALNWGTYGLLNINVVDVLFGSSTLAKAFYTIIALSGLFIIGLKLTMKG
jgi:uncharacterized membrane protein YuzA (DUF378 family)